MNHKDKLVLYNSLCSEAHALLNKYNPCKISNGKCERGYFCCEGCRYLSETTNTCATESLLCILWLCTEARNNVDKVYLEESKKIFIKGLCNDLIVMRGSISDALNTTRYTRYIKEYPEVSVLMPWGCIYKVKIPIFNYC